MSCLQGTFDAGQKTIANSQGAAIATVTIRYSARCETNWVSVENTVKGAEVVKRIERANVVGWLPITVANHHAEEETDAGAGSSYSMQLWAPGDTCVTVSARIRSAEGKTLGSVEGWVLCGAVS